MQNGIEKIGEVIERLGSALAKLTVLHGALSDGVFSALLGLISAAEAGDGRNAALRASDLTAALISSGARRVSGDLMMDTCSIPCF